MKSALSIVLPLSALMVCCAMTALMPNSAHAEEAEASTQLQDAVAKLSTEQQAALLLLLSKLFEDTEAAIPAKPDSPDEALRSSLREYEAAVSAGKFDIKPFLARLSDDFYHPAIGGKTQIEQAIKMAESIGLFKDGVPQITFHLNKRT